MLLSRWFVRYRRTGLGILMMASSVARRLAPGWSNYFLPNWQLAGLGAGGNWRGT